MILIRLPRLPQGYGALQRWWQTVVEAIEGAFADILLAIGLAQNAEQLADEARAATVEAKRIARGAELMAETATMELGGAIMSAIDTARRVRSLQSTTADDGRVARLAAEVARLRQRVANLELEQA